MNLVKSNKSLVFPSLLDEFFRPDWDGGVQSYRHNIPSVNIKESETSFGLEFYAPGLNKSDFNIEIDQKNLSISANKAEKSEEQNEKYSQKEFNFSSFRRTFAIPETVNIDEIEANYENGVLFVKLPKREEALPKPKRQIEIA